MENNKNIELKKSLEKNEIRSQKEREALEHHLHQLHRIGATLEDSVGMILCKVIVQSEAVVEFDRHTDGTWRE